MKRNSILLVSAFLFGIFAISVFSSTIFKRPNNGIDQNKFNGNKQNNIERLGQEINDNNVPQAGSEWHKTFDRNDLYAAAHGNGIYAAVGADGTIKTSSDGETWSINSSHSVLLQGVVWGNGKFVTVGSQGKIFVSDDGKTWKVTASGTDKDLKGVAWNGSLYAAVGDGGTILTSNDGLSWTQQSTEIAYPISGIISGKGKFIATVSDTFNIVLESDNGTDWNTIEPFGQHFGYYNAAFNGSTFIMNGRIPNQDGFVTVKSDDGTSWTEVPGAPKIRSITSNGQTFIAIGDSQMDENGVLTQSIYTSDNGDEWTTNEVKWDRNNSSDLRFIYWCGDKYIGLRYMGDIYRSEDGVNWNREKSGIDYTYEHITWNGNRLAAYNSAGDVAVSDDGSTWVSSTVALPMDKPIINVFYLGGKTIVISGTPAKMYVSGDGANWTTKELEGLENCRILRGGDKYLLITGSALYTSPDAESWELISATANTMMPKGIAYNGQVYVSAGGQGVIHGGEGNQSQPYRIMGVSSDMKDWNISRTDNMPSMNTIVWANDKFVAAGEGGTILNSEDGVSWIQVTSGTTKNLMYVTWDGSRYIASGDAGTILLSGDGVNWVNYVSDITSDTIARIEHVGNKYIGIGSRSILAGTITGPAAEPVDKTFADMENHWAKEYVSEMATRNLVKGVDENNYAPDRQITRSEFAAIIVRALDLKSEGSNNEFSDIAESDWHYESMYAAFDNGIIKGYGGGVVMPQKAITREEAMTMLTRVMKLKGLDTDIDEAEINTVLSAFTDRAGISDWAQEAAAICVKNNIIQGSEGRINPASNITRAETAAVILRMLQKAA